MEPRSRDVVASVRLLSSRLLAIVLGMLAVAVPATSTDIFPVKDLSPGMKGYTLSDLGDGRGVQRFDVEIVGVLKSYAPKQDLVLARVLSEAIEKTGIIAGMSGSPVYVDGRLVGALAYGWPFSREPICGITPIQSMLDIRKAPAAPPVPIGGAAPAAQFLSTFSNRDFADGVAALLSPLRGDAVSSGPVPLPLPVSFSGGNPAGESFRAGGGGRGLDGRAFGRVGSGRRRGSRYGCVEPPRAGFRGRRRAAVRRHGPFGDRHGDVGGRELDPGVRSPVSVDGSGRHAHGARRGPDGAARRSIARSSSRRRARSWARCRRTARREFWAASASRRRWCR